MGQVWSMVQSRQLNSSTHRTFFHSAAPTPPSPQRLQLFPEACGGFGGGAPAGAHAISPQQAVLVLGEAGHGEVEDPFLRPAGFRGEGEDLGR